MTAQATEEMLARAAAGDTCAFAEIVRTHQGMVFSMAYHFLHDRTQAEELAQEVFLQLYRDLRNLQSAAHLTFWLRKVTCHRSIDQARREQRRQQISLDAAPELAITPPVSDPLLAGTLRRLVADLPEKARMVVILRYQEDLEPTEIARLLEMPVNTVKSHLQRALAVLRQRLGHAGKEAFI